MLLFPLFFPLSLISLSSYLPTFKEKINFARGSYEFRTFEYFEQKIIILSQCHWLKIYLRENMFADEER